MVSVPYVALGGYAAFVVISSLLVGILPPLVDRPDCKEKSDKYVIKLDNPRAAAIEELPSENALPKEYQDDSNKKHSKISKRDTSKNVLERTKAFRESHSEFFSRRSMSKVGSYPDLGICSEITNPVPGVRYPWYESRLPTNIVPVNYNVELFVPAWTSPIYDGEIDITFTVKNSTNFLLLHSKLDLPFIEDLRDRNGNLVNVTCVGEFFYNDYYVLKTSTPMTPNLSPYTASFVVIGFFPEYESGIFEIEFSTSQFNPQKSKLLASKFEPIMAREAYPCFDEPGLKATYEISIDHPIGTTALSNTPKSEDITNPALPGNIKTNFAKTPPMPPQLIAYVVFNSSDFKMVEKMADGNVPIRIWTRSRLFDEGLAVPTLDVAVKVFNALQDIFRNVDRSSIPPKIDIFAIPDYPTVSVPHFGLPIFRENSILFDNETVSERDIQKIGLLYGEEFASFWLGNFVTFAWWDELWLETAIADYIKYRAVDEAYPEWNILGQFITEELIYALVDDAYPSTHPIYKPINNPYEIDEYFDEVEKTAAAAIFRMVEEEKNIAEMYDAITAYLNAHPWGVADINVFYNTIGKIEKWSAKDFFDRWTKQANYPLLKIQLIEDIDNQQAIQVTQSRALNSDFSIFSGDLLYPSPFGDFVWYVPLQCSFGTGPYNGNSTYETTFYIDTKNYTRVLPTSSDGLEWIWVHCDRKFTGYYETDYTDENWEYLGTALKLKNNEFSSEDRANIIHNLFLNAFTERTSYCLLRDVLSYLRVERDYLPWRAVYKHVYDLGEVLQYRREFIDISGFFIALMRDVENDIDPWAPAGFHIEELLKETILTLSCFIQDSFCLNKVAELWKLVQTSSQSGNFTNNLLPSYQREVVYNYHMQNTYDVNDWFGTLQFYEFFDDPQEQRKLLEALTYTRLPWLLAQFRTAQINGELNRVDFFEACRLIAQNPTGRELIWDYFRINYEAIFESFGEEDPRIGQLLIDIVSSFENEFLFYELLEFVFYTQTGSTANARFKALEIVSTTNVWLIDKEEEIREAFSGGTCRRTISPTNEKSSKSLKFLEKARTDFEKKFPQKSF